jgi:hypothetical protein
MPKLDEPTTELEKAELLRLVQIHLGAADGLTLRRILYELDMLKQ